MRKALVAGLAAVALTISGCAAAEEVVEEVAAVEEGMPAPEPVEEAPLGDIVDVAVAAGSFTTLAAALEAAGLVDTLKGDGPFTVFAPTDDAFAALPEGLVDALLLEENRDILVQILRYHVVSGSVYAAQVTSGDVPSVEGSNISIEVNGGVVLNGSANVVMTDIEASNGVIHVIDAVILPPGLDVSVLL
jgi:uncharacterized surface protein with fasciclin (FAS1) repeats